MDKIETTDIRIKLADGTWVPASVQQSKDFELAKQGLYNASQITKRNKYCYIINNDNIEFQIADWNGIKMYNINNNDWILPSIHVIWAFYNFVNCAKLMQGYKKTYSGKNVTNHSSDILLPFSAHNNTSLTMHFCDGSKGMVYMLQNGKEKDPHTPMTIAPIMMCNNEMEKYKESMSMILKKTQQKKDQEILRQKQQQEKLESVSWFERVFGFNETLNYENNVVKLYQTYRCDNDSAYFNNVKIGSFDLFYNSRCQNFKDIIGGKVTFENIVSDVKNIHKDEKLSKNATFQVASQLNCLEMLNPNITPKSGITIYEGDNTQGPACAMCTPAGLAYRNYGYNGGQGHKQINMAQELLEFLRMMDNSINWDVKNGYLMIDEPNLRKINKVLVNNQDKRRLARFRIASGSHTDLGVYVDKLYEHNVNHVYCSGLPIAYNSVDPELWRGLGELFLEAMYENTLVIAHLNNIRNGSNSPCYLTALGGGVFGMNSSQIARAIQRACQIAAKKGFTMNIKLVHKNNIDVIYKAIPSQFPLSTVIANSSWDDEAWSSKYC